MIVDTLTVKKITLPGTVTPDDYIVSFIERFHYNLFSVTLKSLNDDL